MHQEDYRIVMYKLDKVYITSKPKRFGGKSLGLVTWFNKRCCKPHVHVQE